MSFDRISELLDSLLTQILSYLPTKDSVKTSVLSKRREFLWLSVPVLDLNVNDFPDFPRHYTVFPRFVDNFLEFNHRSRMQKFKINLNTDYAEYNTDKTFEEWIGKAFALGVQHLDVETNLASGKVDLMTRNIYKRNTLVSLKLVSVGIKNHKSVVSLPCLKTLHLKDVLYEDPLIIERLISGCPVLEDLALLRPFVYSSEAFLLLLLRVRSQALKRLSIRFINNRIRGVDFSVEIDAPGLEYMSLKDDKSERIVVKNLSSLFMIDIDIEFDVNPFEPEDSRKRDTICDFLTGVSSVKHMILSQPTLEVLYRYSKLGKTPIFDNLYRLHAKFSRSILQLLPVFLESCPNLRNLILEVVSVSTEADQTELTYVPQCLLSTLESVEIKEVIMEKETGKKLVRYFFENSVVLKKLLLRFRNRDSDIFKELHTYTKRSRSCQIIIH